MPAITPMKRPGNRTAAELAQRLGISVRTVRRHVAQPRAEYEANSVERTRPWEDEGISRATWYRRRKAEARS